MYQWQTCRDTTIIRWYIWSSPRRTHKVWMYCASLKMKNGFLVRRETGPQNRVLFWKAGVVYVKKIPNRVLPRQWRVRAQVILLVCTVDASFWSVEVDQSRGRWSSWKRSRLGKQYDCFRDHLPIGNRWQLCAWSCTWDQRWSGISVAVIIRLAPTFIRCHASVMGTVVVSVISVCVHVICPKQALLCDQPIGSQADPAMQPVLWGSEVVNEDVRHAENWAEVIGSTLSLLLDFLA